MAHQTGFNTKSACEELKSASPWAQELNRCVSATMHNKVSNIPNKYFMYNKKMPYTFYQKSYLEGVRLQQSRQQGHLLLSVRIRRKDQGLGGIVNEGQHLWGRSRVFWPRDPSGSIRVKVVDEVDQIVCHISRAVDIPEI